MLWQLFITFFKIGAFTIGGGYAMIPIIEREIVDSKHWLDRDEFLDVIALAQTAPGIIAVNLAIVLGWQIRRIKGVLVSVLGAVLPSFVIIVLIATIFTHVSDNAIVEAVFKGIRPAIVALISATVIRLAKQNKITWATAFIPIVALLIIWFVHVSPIVVILLSIVITSCYTYFTQK